MDGIQGPTVDNSRDQNRVLVDDIDAHRGGGGGVRVNIIPPSGKFQNTC